MNIWRSTPVSQDACAIGAASAARPGQVIGLNVNADDRHNGKDNRRFGNVYPQCSLRELENDSRFRHDKACKNIL
jgi:hypothetical protein